MEIPSDRHNLRHTAATDLLRETGNLELVRKMLGHADVSTLQIYLHLTDDDLQATMRGEEDGEAEEDPTPDARAMISESLGADVSADDLRTLADALEAGA